MIWLVHVYIVMVKDGIFVNLVILRHGVRFVREQGKQMSKTPTEHQEQVALFDLVALHLKKYPELQDLYAVPNGSYRHIKTAMKAKREGQKAGVPDLVLPISRMGYHALYIEMKRSKPRGQVKPHQRETMERLAGYGNLCFVAWGDKVAWDIIQAYLEGCLDIGSHTLYALKKKALHIPTP